MSESLNLLHVEDSKDDADLIVRELRRGGYDLDHCRVETLEGFRCALRAKDWDVVISDYALPFFNGLDVLRVLKESGLDLPLILVSGTVGEETAVEVMKGGASDYIMKNNLMRLAPAIRREMEEADNRRKKLEAEKKLQVSSRVFENMMENIIVTNPEGVIITVNKAFTQMTGYTPEEVIGEKPSILKSGRHDNAFYKLMWDSLLSTGHWEGEVWNKRKNGEIYPEFCKMSAIRSEGGMIIYYASISSDITELKKHEDEIKYMAYHDDLTGLPNRLMLNDRLEQAVIRSKSDGKLLAVLCLDIDNFKNINDSLGHAAGDQLLKEVASRLTVNLRKGDTLARFGDDQYVIVMENLASEYEIGASIEKIMVALRKPHRHEGIEVTSTASVGATVYPSNGESALDLVRDAEIAMNHAKNKGKNTYQMFSPQMNEKLAMRLQIENNLRKGIKNKEMVVHYQPKVDMTTGAIFGMEALIRWRSADGTLMAPYNFIPIAEETGLIVDLDEFVLRQSCLFMKRMREAGMAKSFRSVSVNLSVRNMERENLVDIATEIVKESLLEPSCIEFEITESSTIKDVARSVEVIGKFRERGFGVAIDDFGTGYSSLSYLTRFRFSVLKIDRAFVVDLMSSQNARAVAKTITVMAHDMGAKVVAEGVENQDQVEYLSSIGCDAIQGFIFSKPLPDNEAEKLLRANKRYSIVEREATV